jgi:signal transduction histidine kinase
VQAGHPLDLNLRPTDRVAVARGVANEQQQGTERHRVVVEAPEAPVLGAWDPVRLERVISNLVHNAVKYSPDGGDVRVRIGAPEEGWVNLTVSDSGVGIPADDLSRLFSRFHRGANVAGRIAGTDLGLASARLIVEEHGGTIAATSTEGEGTTVTVRLPLGAGPARESAGPHG